MSINHDEDDFAPFVADDLRMNLKQYVQTYFNTAKHSDSPDHALNERHMVDNVGVNKGETAPQHESFIATVADEDTVNRYVFILERTASSQPIQPEESFAYCAQSPDSKTVIDTIQDVLHTMVSGEPPSTPDPLPPSTNNSSNYVTFSQAIHTAMTSTCSSARSFAVEDEDTISGVNKQELGKSVRQYDPRGLTLFHLVLLTLVVHQLAPIYSLFESQCYWFANIIFDVIVAVYPSKSQCRPDPVAGPRILLPSAYLPKEFGRIFGITINDPRVVEAVISVVKSHFKNAKDTYKEKVAFYYFRVYIC